MTFSTEGLILYCKIMPLYLQQVCVWARAMEGLLFAYFLDEALQYRVQ
jgi:hypothetical protein